MARLLIVHYGDESRCEGMYQALTGAGHDVKKIVDASLTTEYGKEFDIILINSISKNTHIVKELHNAEIPIIAGLFSSPLNGLTSSAVALGMGIRETQGSGRKGSGILNTSDVLIGLNVNTEVNLYSVNSWTSSLNISDNVMGTVLVIRGLSNQYNNEAICITYEKGTLNAYGEPFATDCVYFGVHFEKPPTPELLIMMNDVIDWLLEKRYVNARILDKNGVGISRNVKMFRRDNDLMIRAIQSDSDGNAVLRCRRDVEYYAIAFDDDTGTKNAVIIDRIIQE